MARAAVIENSYILPHGTRPAHSPRMTTPARSSTNDSQVSDMAIFAERRPASAGSSADTVRVRIAVEPSPTITSAGAATAATRRRPAANEIAKATIAMVRVIIDA